jgi:NAD(P)-dependent dehydrogenase (short-subunit alcohol dehydrogenase family)
MSKTSKEKIALVTGASRGGGRGIALELALSGYIVYITGRSRKGKTITEFQDLNLDTTKEIIETEGGRCIIVECDHSREEEIRSVFKTIIDAEGRLDVLVNNVWAGYTDNNFNLYDLSDFNEEFWKQPIWRWDNMFQISLRSHFICSQEAAKIMINQKSGLIVTTGFWDDDKYLMNVPYDVVKMAKSRLAYGMAIELKDYNVCAVYLSLGWIRTEYLKKIADKDLDDFNYSEMSEYQNTESTRYAGRAIIALLNDKNLMEKTGKILITGEIAEEYNFTDLDGTKPARFIIPDNNKGISNR